MSGGSFNYLYAQDPYEPEELRRMADDLRSRGMDVAAEETLALIPRRATNELASLWQAVEWHRSCDWSEAQVAEAWVAYTTSRGNQ